MIVYLDNSATTRQYDQVTEVMTRAMRDIYGNPSSLHAMGLAAEKEVRGARKAVASSLSCREERSYSPPAAQKATIRPSLALPGAQAGGQADHHHQGGASGRAGSLQSPGAGRLRRGLHRRGRSVPSEYGPAEGGGQRRDRPDLRHGRQQRGGDHHAPLRRGRGEGSGAVPR